ncbi:hypothetical protein GOBAR_DD07717 [Gossypium barbadense]|nr:hypothetical protein GOBAR_DD07717 [Gossypium barbadense]
MGRPSCCDKVGVNKGPLTPEEDIVLVSYIQEHGPRNWSSYQYRCSKSCRLRWPNYLRPGIRRGNFTEHEEKMIIHLQALLANRNSMAMKVIVEMGSHLQQQQQQQQQRGRGRGRGRGTGEGFFI